MKTDELLEKATKSPWVARVYSNSKGEVDNIKVWAGSEFHGNLVCAMSANTPAAVQGTEAFANAELLCRAVNAFEPMREALRKVAQGTEWLTNADFDAIRAALALAEGEEWEVNPRWAENNQPLTKKKP